MDGCGKRCTLKTVAGEVRPSGRTDVTATKTTVVATIVLYKPMNICTKISSIEFTQSCSQVGVHRMASQVYLALTKCEVLHSTPVQNFQSMVFFQFVVF